MRHRSLLAAAALLAACSSLQPSGVRVRGDRGGAPDVPRLGGSPDGTAPTLGGTTPGRGDLQGTAARPTTAATRRVCRGGAWPSGWIAVGYEAGAKDECPKGGPKESAQDGATEAPRVAVLARYTGQPVGATLDVCADQHVPIDWLDVHEEADAGQCPGAGPNGASATRRIRRAR